jgi:hypothetical protein
MCFRRKKPPVTSEPAEKTVIHFGKNKYPGGQSLNGCVPDSNNALKDIGKLWPEVKFIQKLDDDCTAKNWLEIIKQEIALLPPGGTVFWPSDSCFSESVSRFFNPADPFRKQIRSYHPGYPRLKLTRSSPFHPKENMKWIQLSACGETQTASDAYFKGYEGAFSHYFWKALEKGITYRELIKRVQSYLPSKDFEQTPIGEGPDYLLDRVIMEGPTLWIMNSSHGSYQWDKSGDEADGQDEGIYFDRLIVDDEMYEILQTIKV